MIKLKKTSKVILSIAITLTLSSCFILNPCPDIRKTTNITVNSVSLKMADEIITTKWSEETDSKNEKRIKVGINKNGDLSKVVFLVGTILQHHI